MVPYKDFELLFMPLYTYLISLITRIFGYDLIVLRIVGVLIFVGMALFSYKIFRNIFNEWISTVAAIVTVFYVQSEAPLIFYDYIRVFDLLTYASLYFLLRFVCRSYQKKKARLSLISSGILAAGAFCTRQNSGAFVIAFGVLLLIFLLIVEKFDRRRWIDLLVYALSAILPLVLLVGVMALAGILGDFLDLTVFSALDAKGGLLTVLFAWIPRVIENIRAHQHFALFLIVLLGYSYYQYFIAENKQIDRSGKRDMAVGVTFVLMITVGIGFAYFNTGTTAAFLKLKVDTLPDTFFVAVVFMFVVELVYLLLGGYGGEDGKYHLALFTLTGMIIAIGYGCGTSFGLAEGQTGLAVGVTLGLLLQFANAKKANAVRAVALVMAGCMVMSTICYKYITPYSWWGQAESDLRQATEKLDVEYMKGIRVTPETKYGIETIVDTIEEYSDETDHIFSFPQIPIFYLLSDRYPNTFTLVQWFDVANDQDVAADIDTLKADPPKVIVHAHVYEWIMASHEAMFRSEGVESGLRQMDRALTQLEQDEGYVMAASFMLQGYPFDVWYLPAEGETAVMPDGQARQPAAES